MADIQHQPTQLHSLWQNGQIERLFGRLKPLLRQLSIPNPAALQRALVLRVRNNETNESSEIDSMARRKPA
jgi:hypothetical protein